MWKVTEYFQEVGVGKLLRVDGGGFSELKGRFSTCEGRGRGLLRVTAEPHMGWWWSSFGWLEVET